MRIKTKFYQKLLWIPKAIKYNDGRELIPLIDIDFTKNNGPSILWTLYFNEDQNNPPNLPIIPNHLTNAFLEYYIHDWNITENKLKYYSRVSTGHHWVLLEFEQPVSEYYRETFQSAF